MRIEISQEQRQIISPALIQTLELVMLPALELKDKIEEEAKANPAIQLERKKPESKISKNRQKSQSGFDSQAFLENLSVYDFSLYRYMMEQINDLDYTEREKKIAEIILSSVNDKGFLRQVNSAGAEGPIDPELLLKDTGISPDEFEAVREKIKMLDPLGIATYQLSEYLQVQAAHVYGRKSLEYKILSQCIDLLEKKLFSKIARELNVNYESVERAIENIGKMNMSPASSFNSGVPQYVIPDAFVNITDDGIQLTLNDEYIPNVKLNQQCIDLYSSETYKGKKASLGKDDKLFLKENIERAKNLIENLKSRKEIIFKVILKIVEKQRDFFIKGIQYQVPLKLKDIADELNIHESTVSRVVREKYIQTNKGIINLKSFFSTNIGNQETSSKSVKEMLKTFIEAEDKDDPLSDDKIVQIYKKKGIQISRRTVAKYRAELNISPAFMRRNPI